MTVPEYEVISPYQTDESGDWIDYSLHGQSRTRRSTNGANFWYFKVNAFGRLIHLNLTKVNPYVTSGALVQTVHKNGSSTYKEIPRSVYYTGHVMSDPESLVAITGKNGLVSEKAVIITLFNRRSGHISARLSKHHFIKVNHNEHHLDLEKPNLHLLSTH